MLNLSFIQYEMKSATEKLIEALYLRGFFVKETNGVFSLINGSEQDIQELKILLESCSIPVLWNGDKFQLLVNYLPTEKVKEVVSFKGFNHHVSMQAYHFKWRSFVNRRFGIRTSTIANCPYSAIFGKALNVAGIVTLCGCNGHGRHQPNFQLSGIYNGIWFMIIQEKYLAKLSLHYDWKMEYDEKTNRTLVIANKVKDADWDMLKVLADCEKMASVLLKHSDEIRALKRKSFKRNMKEEAELLRKAGNIKGLYNWMKNKVEENITSVGNSSVKSVS